MPKLFGLDIAGIVNKAVKDASGVLEGTLTRVINNVETGSDITGGDEATTDHIFNGFFEDTDEVRRKGQLTSTEGEFVFIFVASISPVTTPETTDRITLEGRTVQIVEIVSRDPAAAGYLVRVEA